MEKGGGQAHRLGALRVTSRWPIFPAETSMIIENNAGGHIFRERTCIRCKMTKQKFAESGYPECRGKPPDENKRSEIAIIQDDNGAA